MDASDRLTLDECLARVERGTSTYRDAQFIRDLFNRAVTQLYERGLVITQLEERLAQLEQRMEREAVP